MKLQWLVLALLGTVVGAVLMVACNSRASTINTNSLTVGTDGIQRISVAEAKQSVDKGDALVIDTRDNASYQQEHIKGSINIPMADIESRSKELPKNKFLIAYCS